MAAITIEWNDGSGDVITIDPKSGSDDGTLSISTPANRGYSRRKRITVRGIKSLKTAEFVIIQKGELDTNDSCYGNGYWLNDAPWLNDDAWANE